MCGGESWWQGSHGLMWHAGDAKNLPRERGIAGLLQPVQGHHETHPCAHVTPGVPGLIGCTHSPQGPQVC
jgi:hypothetical protein